MSELKSCPFCGSVADYADVPESIPTCTNAKCKMSFGLKMSDEQWNTRPIEDAQSALIEQMGEFIDWLYNSNELAYSGNVRLLTVGGILKKYEEWKDGKK